MNFYETVLYCFDNKEYVDNWRRLRKVSLPWNNKKFKLFISDVENLIWDRIPLTDRGGH